MPLSATQIAVCATIFGVGAGSVGTLAVQKVSPGKEVARAKQGRSEARVQRVAPPPAAPALLDCPLVSPFSAEPVPALELPTILVGGGVATPWAPPVRGGGGGATAPSIPEPAQWAMLLAGFGLVGLSCRARDPRLTRNARRRDRG